MNARSSTTALNLESIPGQVATSSSMKPLAVSQTGADRTVAKGGVPSVEIGTIVGTDLKGQPIVTWGDGLSTATARVVWMSLAPSWNACRDLRVALAFESGNPERPIVVGLLEEPPALAFAGTDSSANCKPTESGSGVAFSNVEPSAPQTAETLPKPMGLTTAVPPPDAESWSVIHMVLPGEEQAATPPKTHKLTAQEELVLECGKARISLRADGRVVIEGGYLLSRSTGVNKIMGGSVHIN
jgi:hypothetical protein